MIKFEIQFDNLELDENAIEALRLAVLLAVKPLYQQLRFDNDVTVTQTEIN